MLLHGAYGDIPVGFFSSFTSFPHRPGPDWFGLRYRVSLSLLSLESVFAVMCRDVISVLSRSSSASLRLQTSGGSSAPPLVASAHVRAPQRGREGRDNGDPWSASPLRCFLWLLVHDALQESTKMRVCCGIIAVVVLLGNVDSAAAQGESLRLIWDRLRATLSRDLKSASENISSFFLSSLRLKSRGGTF